MQNFVQNGDFIHTVLAGTVKAGDLVVIENIAGVATTAGDGVNLVAVQVEGVFSLPQKSGDTGVISQGGLVYWDNLDGCTNTDSSGSNAPIGIAWEASVKNSGSVVVKLCTPIEVIINQ